MRLLLARHAHPLRHRLWLAASGTGLIVATFIVVQFVARMTDASPRLEMGGDFVPAYAAGKLVREGRAQEVYDLATMAAVEREIVAEANLEPLPLYGPYLNPPWFAALYAPLAGLPYRTAAGVWLGINLLCAAVAILLLCRMLPGPVEPRAWGLIPVCVVISMPFWQAVCHLQNSCVSLLVVSAIVTCWRNGDGNAGKFVAGALSGLLFYKPQLACVLSAVACLSIGWRALAGCVGTVSGLVAATIVGLPGTLSAYLHSLPEAVATIQTRPAYNWGRQVTPRGFWHLLIQGHQGGPEMLAVTVLSWVMMGGAAILTVIAVWRARKIGNVDRLIAATIAGMPLLMPYYMDYDLLLLVVPATLLAREWMKRQEAPVFGRQLLWVWSALFVALYVNPGLSGQTRLNLAAPLVAIVGFATMIRCTRQAQEAPAILAGDESPVALAA